jgi:GTPase SAR1 family protein
MSDVLKFSILTIGDSTVGKSSLLLRFCNNDNGKMDVHMMPTIGIDYKTKNLEIDGKSVKLQVVSN